MKILTTFLICIIIASACNSQNKKTNSAELTDTSNYPKVSYKDYHGSLRGINSCYDFEEGLECAKVSKKPYLVYFTGYGSIQARQMEAEVMLDEKILNSLKNEFVISTLYVDDRTLKLEIEKQIISELTGDTIKMYGQKQAYIEKNKFNDDKYPAFFIVNSNGQILAGPYYFDLNKKKFLDFLKEGKVKYKN